MKKVAIRRFGAVLLLIFILTPVFLLFPTYRPLAPTGPYRVDKVRYTYSDESRIEEFSRDGEYRKVNVAFWFPQNPGVAETYPLIVFSHGGLGTENGSESLFLDLASHGYVVGSIGHPYHALWTKADGGQVTLVSKAYFQELQREDAKQDKEGSFHYYQKWMRTRTADINFVIDTILEKAAKSVGGVYSLIDGDRIGVMGHSLGGSAVLGIPRQRDDVSAAIALESPFLCDIVGVENDEFTWLDEAYPVPVLNIYSDSSWGHLSEWPQYARNAALLSAAPETALSLHLPGAGHFSMTDLSLASPLLTTLLEGGQPNHDRAGYLQEVNRACLDFLDRYLKNTHQNNQKIEERRSVSYS
jgi:predicted dienelactone hydrolase